MIVLFNPFDRVAEGMIEVAKDSVNCKNQTKELNILKVNDWSLQDFVLTCLDLTGLV